MEILFDREPSMLKLILHRYMFQAERLPVTRFYHSKISAAILFYHFARYSGDNRYREFADELIGQVSGNISYDSPINFGYGLSGMAWGVYYLINESFISGDVNAILSDVDLHIMERDLYRISDVSFDSGLSGIIFYVESRVAYASSRGIDFPFDKRFLKEISIIKNRSKLELLNIDDVLLRLWVSMKYMFKNS